MAALGDALDTLVGAVLVASVADEARLAAQLLVQRRVSNVERDDTHRVAVLAAVLRACARGQREGDRMVTYEGKTARGACCCAPRRGRPQRRRPAVSDGHEGRAATHESESDDREEAHDGEEGGENGEKGDGSVRK